MTAACKRVLDRAWSEAESLGHAKIKSDHLLIGLLASETAAAELLRQNEVSEHSVRKAITNDDPDEHEL